LKGDACHGHGAVASEEPIEAGRASSCRTYVLFKDWIGRCLLLRGREVAATYIYVSTVASTRLRGRCTAELAEYGVSS
jgi:hypothetical protein